MSSRTSFFIEQQGLQQKMVLIVQKISQATIQRILEKRGGKKIIGIRRKTKGTVQRSQIVLQEILLRRLGFRSQRQ